MAATASCVRPRIRFYRRPAIELTHGIHAGGALARSAETLRVLQCRLACRRDAPQTAGSVGPKARKSGGGKDIPAVVRCHKRSVFVRRENRPTVRSGQGRFCFNFQHAYRARHSRTPVAASMNVTAHRSPWPSVASMAPATRPQPNSQAFWAGSPTTCMARQTEVGAVSAFRGCRLARYFFHARFGEGSHQVRAIRLGRFQGPFGTSQDIFYVVGNLRFRDTDARRELQFSVG